jgi:serine/threonine protein kinase
LAKLEDNNEGLTMIGTNMGKIQYNAPEQRRNAAAVDHRADIYPLGVMFFEMLVGSRPKPGMVLSEMCPDVPPGAEEFLAKAMAENPDERFQSAKEFEDALMVIFERYQKGERAADEKNKKAKGGGLFGWLKALFAKKPKK